MWEESLKYEYSLEFPSLKTVAQFLKGKKKAAKENQCAFKKMKPGYCQCQKCNQILKDV